MGIKGNYTSEENLHLTLAFIGEYKDPRYVMDVLEGLSFNSFPMELEGFGNFGDLYWVGIKDGDSWYYVMDSMVKDGTFTIEGKEYTFDANGVWIK